MLIKPLCLLPNITYMLGIALLVQLSYVTHRLNWTPTPQRADSPGSVFSEDRAMQHVVALTKGIGDHQVTVSYDRGLERNATARKHEGKHDTKICAAELYVEWAAWHESLPPQPVAQHS